MYVKSNLALQKPSHTPYKWVILFLYLLSDLIPSLLVTTTTPIAPQICSIYKITPSLANLTNLVFLISAAISTVVVSKYLDEKGVSFGIKLGAFICIIGSWIRLLVDYNFYFLILGNFIIGLGAPFIINSRSKIAANWFSLE